LYFPHAIVLNLWDSDNWAYWKKLLIADIIATIIEIIPIIIFAYDKPKNISSEPIFKDPDIVDKIIIGKAKYIFLILYKLYCMSLNVNNNKY
jgi:hypothetical protein